MKIHVYRVVEMWVFDKPDDSGRSLRESLEQAKGGLATTRPPDCEYVAHSPKTRDAVVWDD